MEIKNTDLFQTICLKQSKEPQSNKKLLYKNNVSKEVVRIVYTLEKRFFAVVIPFKVCESFLFFEERGWGMGGGGESKKTCGIIWSI